MAIRLEKTGKDTHDIVIDGFETGIAPSPHKGIANIQNANISTELGEVVCSFARTQQSYDSVTGGTLTASIGDGTTLLDSSVQLSVGQQITLTAATITTSATSYVVDALVVGGGGAGGGVSTSNNTAGGGGGGGQVNESTATIAVGAYAVTVGSGGTGASNADGGNGVSSTFATLTGTGGGGGGKTGNNGVSGASGGGAGTGVKTGGTASAGHVGGDSTTTGGGGGGGGSGAIGTNGTGAGAGGNGGNGTASSLSGASVTYGGGGGGGATQGNNSGTGGTGGGATTSDTGQSHAGSDGTANLGGGGSGARNAGSGTTANAGGNGGSGVVIISYTTGDLTATGGTITTSGGKTIHTFTTSGTFTVTAINYQVTLPLTTYYVSYVSGSKIKLSTAFDPTGSNFLVHSTSGTATFNTVDLGNSIAYATEEYFSSGARYYRYYILDANGRVWVYDTGLAPTTGWFLPYATPLGNNPSGITVLDGWLLVFGTNIACKSTALLGETYSSMANVELLAQTSATHYAMTGHQGRAYYTDGDYVGSIFPDTSLNSAPVNTQSFASWVPGHADDYGLWSIIGGAVPWCGLATSDANYFRIPVVFFTTSTGTLPSSITADTVYYLQTDAGFATGEFQVYSAATGGSAISDLRTGASGTQYFNTFYPIGSASTFVFSPQRVNLPSFESAQFLVELNNTILIGCAGNVVYPWNQIDATPSGLISLPEGNVQSMLTVNQMAYIFAGNQGNVYITDGSTASLVLNMPDYVAGVPGSPGTYIESTYTWGGTMYLRGRVYFSVLDQTSSKAGNCGGIWSFVPTQNVYIGQDTGIGLRLEAQNSYLTYNGVDTLLIPNQTQNAQEPLYWSAWYSDVTTPTYGIDYSTAGTSASAPAIIETDAIPFGTMLEKKTVTQLEYKLGAPLDTSATITAKYRTNLTDSWTPCSPFILETNRLSGYAPANFQQVQWVQFQFTLTPITSSADTNTFIRFRQIRLR